MNDETKDALDRFKRSLDSLTAVIEILAKADCPLVLSYFTVMMNSAVLAYHASIAMDDLQHINELVEFCHLYGIKMSKLAGVEMPMIPNVPGCGNA